MKQGRVKEYQMKINKTLLIALFSLLASTLYAQNAAKYVFLFIGDGMGDNAIYATELYKKTLEEPLALEPMAMNQLSVQSFMVTSSANSLQTDSAAGGTAIATGVKTTNKVLAMDTTLQFNLETVGEKAKKAGYKVGILSSVAIDHATPAAFYAHNKSRHAYDEIALQLLTSNFDYFAGGGVHNLGNIKDKKSFAYQLDKSEYRYLTSAEEIKNLKKGDEKIVAVNPGTYSGIEYYWEIDKPKESLSLAYMTKKGIELLDNEKGFFMMVEGGKIDWALHSNDLGSSIQETLALDDAVKVALDFYNSHKDETLIIVTADHETGGLILGSSTSKGLRMDLYQHQKISEQEFERKLDVLKKLKRKVSFEEVLDSVATNFGLGSGIKELELTDLEKEWLQVTYKKEFIKGQEINPDRDYLDQSSDKNFTERVIIIMSQKTGVAWPTTDHTAARVPVKAIGVGEDYFKTSIDNTEVHDIILKVMGIPNNK
ncbi:MAG: alkaline phosphatase [Flavobacteriaceae bacterium]|nr:alkaline phosphatase [Flavobacteriaceae bacterium]